MACIYRMSIVVFGIYLFIFEGVIASDVCYDTSGATRYCSGEHEYCCKGGYYCCTYTYLTVAAIVGIVIGSLIALGCLITGICICLQQQKRHPGTVIHPQTYTGTVSYVSYPGQQGLGQGQYGVNPYGTQYGMAAPSYSSGQSGSTAYTNVPPPVYKQ